MKKAFRISTTFTFLFYTILIPVIPLFSQQDKKIRIAVLDLQAEGISESEAKTLTSRLRSKLVSTNVFEVLEREQMDAVLQEQGFQQSGCVSDECLVEIGRMVGVEQMVGGSIGKIGETYTLDLRIIDVATGRIIRTVSDDYRGNAEGLLERLEAAAHVIAFGKEAKTEKKGSSWYYWVGGGVLAAGAAVLLMSGGSNNSGGGSSSTLPAANGLWPPK